MATYKGREIIETPPQLALRYMEEKIAYFGNVVSLHFILCFAMWCMTPKTGKKRNISTSLKVNNIWRRFSRPYRPNFKEHGVLKSKEAYLMPYFHQDCDFFSLFQIFYVTPVSIFLILEFISYNFVWDILPKIHFIGNCWKLAHLKYTKLMN